MNIVWPLTALFGSVALARRLICVEPRACTGSGGGRADATAYRVNWLLIRIGWKEKM